jgi:hypothetical protein
MLDSSSCGSVELFDPLDSSTLDDGVQCSGFSSLNIFLLGTARGVSTEMDVDGWPSCSGVANSAVATADKNCSGG